MWKILIASESPGTMREQVHVLENNNFTVYSAPTAEDALTLQKERKADLIIADLNLPEMGGDALCRAIKTDSALRSTYVIISCTGSKSDLKRCGLCGADAYIKNAIDAVTLTQRITSTLEMPRKRATRVLVKVVVNGTFRTEPFYCTSHDLSISGMKLETDKTLAKSDEIYCSFFLPETDKINATAKVVRIEKPVEGLHTYGVEFTDMPEAQRFAIDNFINNQRAEGNFK